MTRNGSSKGKRLHLKVVELKMASGNDDHLLFEPVPEVEPELFADNDDDGLDDITHVVNSLIQRDPGALREARPSMSGTAAAKLAADEVAAAAHVARTGEAAVRDWCIHLLCRCAPVSK